MVIRRNQKMNHLRFKQICFCNIFVLVLFKNLVDFVESKN